MDGSSFDSLIKFSSLFPGQVYCLDTKNIYLWCNTSHAKALGLETPDEVIGKSNKDFAAFNADPEVIKTLEKNNLEILNSGTILIKKEPFTYPNGKLITLSSIKIPLQDAQGIKQGIFCFSIADTILSNEHQLLCEQTNFILSGIVSNLPEHVYWKDRDGHYLGCNEIQAKDLGFSTPYDVVGKTDYDLSPKPLADAFRKIDMEVIKTGKIIEAEETVEKANTTRIMLSKKAPLHGANGEIKGIIGISMDITNLKEAQESEKKALEEASSAKAKVQAQEEIQQALLTFTGTMSHDLRTPLSSIQVNTIFLEKTLPILVDAYQQLQELSHDEMPPLDQHQVSLLEDAYHNILNATAQAESYIDTTLKILKGAATGSELLRPDDLAPCSIEEVLRRVLRNYPFKEGESSKLHSDTFDGFLFMGNSIFMARVLQNLIKNAFEQICLKGRGEIFITCEQGKTLNYLKIKDTAGGITPSLLECLFDGFNSTKAKGTGLGLSSAKQIMKTFSGDIACYLVEGDCIEFKLSFPKIN